MLFKVRFNKRDEYRRSNGLSCETLVNWICALSFSEGIMKVKQSSVWSSVDRMLRKKSELAKCGKMDDVRALMAKQFSLSVQAKSNTSLR